MSSKRRLNRGSHTAAIIALLTSLIVACLFFFNRQYFTDQLSVWQYAPSDQIVALADNSGMGDGGKFFFYASKPTLEPAKSFNEKCNRKEKNTAILGCYNGQFIYIYNVTDAKLSGIREVTAAHEMLHAAYDRLTNAERDKVNRLVEKEYETLKDNPALAERMAFYARTEPGERDNELHSLIGTEVASISPQLEAHYKRYFNDRGRVVVLHAKYEKIFNDLQARSKTLSDQLTELGTDIEAGTSRYNTSVNQLNQDIEIFNERAQSGEFDSEAAFTSAREELLDRARQLERARATINGQVAQYEALRQELISVASESDALNKSIDSSLAPAPSL
jgi:hypothetical protein